MANNKHLNYELYGVFDDPIGRGRINQRVRISGVTATCDREALIEKARKARVERMEMKRKFTALSRILVRHMRIISLSLQYLAKYVK